MKYLNRDRATVYGFYYGPFEVFRFTRPLTDTDKTPWVLKVRDPNGTEIEIQCSPKGQNTTVYVTGASHMTGDGRETKVIKTRAGFLK